MNFHRRPPFGCSFIVHLVPPARFGLFGFFLFLLAMRSNGDELAYNRDVRPILSEHCFPCHGPDEATREAGLRLDLPHQVAEVVSPGNPEESELVRRIQSADLDERMPPQSFQKQLSPSQRARLTRWVQEGARTQGHWAFQRPRRELPPEVAGDDWSNSPIDRYVYARLRKQGLEPSRRADPETLVRRITLDLTGLPPTPAEVDAFLDDELDLAIEKLIDRLMHSPRYGEHMALPWLEASRYADTDGYQNDRYRYQHVWRDWVIEAFNDNMPYDQFVLEQLAGDMLPSPTLRQQIATGFGRNHRINSEDGSIPEEWRVENVIDRVDTFGTVFLGLTITCARCHDHKYDPISQKEYYQLFAYFNNVAEWGVGPNNGNSPPFIEVPASWPHLSANEDRLIEPEPVKLRGAREEKGNGLKRPQAGSPSTVMVMHELQQPRETYVLQRGQYNMPDTSLPVVPNVPRALGSAEDLPQDRLGLAQWLLDPSNPLTARVAVNRMWQQFFGVGLVETSENFGSQGALPTHPALLDWLALQLVDDGWDLRATQRRILLSATYQQSSRLTPELVQRDPENRWLARGPRYRLPPFTLRDQALLVSGLLVEKIGGPSAKPYMPPRIWSSISNNKYEQDHGENLYRRSLYTYWRRTIPPPTMMNFNAAAREVCIVRTQPTNTPLQALTLMNNKIFVESSRCMAEHMIHHSPSDRSASVVFGFRLACGRRPTDSELSVLLRTHDQFLEHFQQDLDSAVQLLGVGEMPRDESLSVEQHAAMTMIASLILNLDETITRE